MNKSLPEEKKIIVITRAFGEKNLNEYPEGHDFYKKTARLLRETSVLGCFLADRGAKRESIFFRYKKLNHREIYLLPCYKEVHKGQSLSYAPLEEREELLLVIAKQFGLRENGANELYIHDTEWGSPYYDYNAITELKRKKREISKFFNGIYVFAHSPISEYFKEIVMEGFKNEPNILETINCKRDALISIENGLDLTKLPLNMQLGKQPETLEGFAEWAENIIKH